MAFHLGQRVFCLKTWSENARIFQIAVPQRYCIYTIRAFCPNSDVPSLLLEEICNTRVVTFRGTKLRGEPSFYSEHFRPLVNLYETFSISTTAPAKKELENNGTH